MFYLPTPLPGAPSEEWKTDDRDSVSSYNDYETDLQRLTENEIQFIRTYSLAGNLRLTKIRSIYWRFLLGIFPESFDEWITTLQQLRTQYNQLKAKFTIDPHNSSCIPDDNPLSLDQNSIWNKYFCDQELKRFIRLDVTRTSADRNLSQLPNVHDRLVEILFLYARQNPDICYRQGMHELLTPIVSVLHFDCDNFVKENRETVILDSTLTEILDPNYLDHDAYIVFSCIMNDMKKFYEVEGVPDSSGYFPSQSNQKELGLAQEIGLENVVSNYLNELQDELRRLDAPLHNHLKSLNINFSVFGIRWLRLLFGREFSFEKLLILWDAIFAINSNLALVRFISLALLIIQRQTLLESDEVECWKHLMTCPCSVDVTQVINYALYLKNPQIYKKPILPQNYNGECAQVNYNFQNSPRETITSQLNQKKWTHIFKNKKTGNTNSTLEDQFNIVDEFSPRSFGMLVSELKRMRLMMSLCKIKLIQYHDVLAKSVPGDDDAAVRALEGIGEICQFLDVDHFSLKSTPSTEPEDVETAHEAEEEINPRNAQLSHSYSSATLDVVATFLPPPNTDCHMLLFKYSENESTDLSRFPQKNPLRRNY